MEAQKVVTYKWILRSLHCFGKFSHAWTEHFNKLQQEQERYVVYVTQFIYLFVLQRLPDSTDRLI